jgi:hypothetical protein
MIKYVKILFSFALLFSILLFSGCKNDLNPDIFDNPCITNIMCAEGYVSYDTGELDSNNCPILSCRLEDDVFDNPCITNIMCDEGYVNYDTGEFDSDNCPVLKCKADVLICQEKNGSCCIGDICIVGHVLCAEGSFEVYLGCDENCSPKHTCQKCITNIMCAEGYISYETGELDSNNCPILSCIKTCDLECEKYSYGNCPEGCIERCSPSGVSCEDDPLGGLPMCIATGDCNGPLSCSCP